MPTNQRSAAAYDKLASLTNAANHAARLAHSWLKLSRAIRDLQSDLKLNEPADSQLLIDLGHWHITVIAERAEARLVEDRLFLDCISLNEKIQNGVFNDDDH